MRRPLLAAFALLLTAPAVSAHHWTYDSGSDYSRVGDSSCASISTDATCTADYLCTGGAPPQLVDLALYCALRAAGEAPDVAAWIPVFAWAFLDDIVRLAEGAVGGILCNQVWSAWCTVPDPVGPYPL